MRKTPPPPPPPAKRTAPAKLQPKTAPPTKRKAAPLPMTPARGAGLLGNAAAPAQPALPPRSAGLLDNRPAVVLAQHRVSRPGVTGPSVTATRVRKVR